jgi:hypothetical protein
VAWGIHQPEAGAPVAVRARLLVGSRVRIMAGGGVGGVGEGGVAEGGGEVEVL